MKTVWRLQSERCCSCEAVRFVQHCESAFEQSRSALQVVHVWSGSGSGCQSFESVDSARREPSDDTSNSGHLAFLT